MLDFQSQLFNTRFDLADAVAAAWFQDSPKTQTEFAGAYTLQDVAVSEWTDCQTAWDLTEDWLAERGLDDSDMRKAFLRFAESLPQ